VFYDDVQYDKHGWRNRNRIKTAQGSQWLTIPVHARGVTRGIPIKDVRIDWSTAWASRHLRALTFAYARAPHFAIHRPWLESLYARRDEFLADFTIDVTIDLARRLGIAGTRFVRASELGGIEGQRTDRLIRILQHVGARHYVSGPSAESYLEHDKLAAAGITLEFLAYNYPEYVQLHPPYDPFVSALDLLFMKGDEAPSFLG
jgi:hypothetical protein